MKLLEKLLYKYNRTILHIKSILMINIKKLANRTSYIQLASFLLKYLSFIDILIYKRKVLL